LAEIAGRLGLVLGSAQKGGPARQEEGIVAIQRHGSGASYVLPHRIDHRANMRALKEAGCHRVLAIGSVGSLRPELAPGSLVVPDDFIALGLPPTTSLEGPGAHLMAGLDPGLRERIVDVLAGGGIEACDGGVYWQTAGPRFETPAEVRLIASHAEVVGMTVGAECAAACELGLAYAALCSVDNLANGVAGEEVSLETVDANRAAGRELLASALTTLLPSLT
jgi:5'-methylthioinosine phosphorylase